MLVRIVGQAPLAATVYSLERLRCGACGQVFTAQGAGRSGPGKVRRDGGGDDRATQVRQRDCRSTGWNKLEGQLGIPLPAATQWEIVEEAAELIKPARDELIRQAAQGEVLHNDDTSMKVLKLEREPGDEAHRRVHQRHRFDRAGPEDRACTSPGASTPARTSPMC